MLSRLSRTLIVCSAMGLAACSSDRTVTATADVTSNARPSANGVMQRYVAIGTSVSMGWQSDGLVAATQSTSWPAQLSATAGRELSLPLIDGIGCRSPLVAPLATGLRLSGESAAADPATLSCSALKAGVTLPVSNLAINAALVRDALFTTSDNITDRGNAALYSRVLEPGQTQVSSMMRLNPKLVSVEFGGNEVLNSRTGVAIPGVTIFPVSAWQPLYDALLDSVSKATKMAVLVGLIQDVRTFPAFRRGDELWQDRAEFAALNVAVSSDCQGSENLLFMPVRGPLAAGSGAAYARNGLGAFPLSCAAGPATTEDYVLTPAEVSVVNDQMHAMSAHIRSEATRRGFAYFELGALYDRTDIKGAYSAVAQLTTASPYGPLVSLDGVHPSAAGARILAEAAAAALTATYGLRWEGQP
jgi:hypothetical protein